jgi:hypothetical protein
MLLLGNLHEVSQVSQFHFDTLWLSVQSGGKWSASVKAGSQAEARDNARRLGTLTNNRKT